MADFQAAIKLTLQNEGGFVDNPNDPGGATKYGIRLSDLPGWTIDQLKAMTEEFAINWYHTTDKPQRYWNPLYQSILSQPIADKIFDMGVLFGVETSVVLLQDVVGTEQDGVFGATTLKLTDVAEPVSLLKAYKEKLFAHTLGLFSVNKNLRQFSVGWTRRINS